MEEGDIAAVESGLSGVASNQIRPELVIGIVAAAGTPIERVAGSLEAALKNSRYEPETLHLSRYTERFKLSSPAVPSNPEYVEYLDSSMNRGTEARETTGRDDVLALTAIADIHLKRRSGTNSKLPKSFVLRQLKHPAEIHLLREAYGDGFIAVGFYMPRSDRERNLRERGVPAEEIKKLIDRDDYEGTESGQRFRDTFHLSDAFVDCGIAEESEKELDRLFSLILGTNIITPRKEEFGMFQAFGAALRSSQMGRQVGAAILSEFGDVISVGTNEVPKRGGGSYWEGDDSDKRDHKLGADSNDKMKSDIVDEIVRKFGEEGLLTQGNDENGKRARKALEASRVDSLIEFGRAVHAEADALGSALRLGKSPVRAALYCTTFPCHLCAKQIIVAGIGEVIFIEPYPKSLASELHGDAITVEETADGKVLFKPFVGVAPRRYIQLFSTLDMTGKQISRKDDEGKVKEGLFHPRVRVARKEIEYREQLASEQLRAITEYQDTRNTREGTDHDGKVDP